MHELSICRALLQQVEALSQRHDAAQVRCITLRIGPLSGVEPALLAQAFEIARAGSCAEHARLDIDTAAVRVQCLQCGEESAVAHNRLICAACGSWRTRLLSGDELLLQRVELQPAAEASTHGD